MEQSHLRQSVKISHLPGSSTSVSSNLEKNTEYEKKKQNMMVIKILFLGIVLLGGLLLVLKISV